MSRRRRSCLAVPGSNERMLAKAAALPADEVVVDLEDAVAPSDKERARELAVAALRSGFRGTAALRANARGTAWWEDDLRAAAEAGAEVVVLPKVESPEDVAAAAELLIAGTGIEALVETARGVAEVERIAAAGHGLEALLFGPADFAASVGIPVLTIGAGSWDYVLARIVVAARANGLQAVDGPHAVLDDEPGLLASAQRAVSFGFDGKWAIHPSQIEPLNAAFTPSAEQVARARALLATEGAARDGGEMVDAVSRRLAESVLARLPEETAG
ncbi:MAG TPA: CoA ester lyase [Gaiellaceae bacterium]|nr:CoA ester lyase [Gaiellaceae bacterium]